MKRREFGSNELQQLALLGLLSIVAPLALYPNDLGMTKPLGQWWWYPLELAYAATVMRLVRVADSLAEALIAGAIAMAFRHALGVVFGGLVYMLGTMTLSGAIALGLFDYAPAVTLLMIVSPFVGQSAVRALLAKFTDAFGEAEESGPVFHDGRRRARAAVSSPKSALSHPASRHTTSAVDLHTRNDATKAPDSESSAWAPDNDRTGRSGANGFDRAVSYVAEMGAVRVVSVVDRQGLEVASFARMGFGSWAWSPHVITMFSSMDTAIPASKAAEKIDVSYDDMRVMGRRVAEMYFLVVAERYDDETLNVRVTQACESIARWAHERYSKKILTGVEERYVRSVARAE